jgi:predicted acyl esterase
MNVSPAEQDILTIGPAHQQETPDVYGAEPPYALLADRPDVVAFRTALLAEAVEVTGAAVVELWVSSSAIDTDFTAKLIDVHLPNVDRNYSSHIVLPIIPI